RRQRQLEARLVEYFSGRRETVELGSLQQNRLLEHHERRRRFDPELLPERCSQAAIRAQTLGLPLPAVQRHHHLCPQSFPKRVLGNGLFGERNGRVVVSTREQGIEAKLERVTTKLREPRHISRRPLAVDELDERVASPLLERALRGARRTRRVATGEPATRVLDLADDAVAVELIGADPDHVARPTSHQLLHTERLPQLAAMTLPR